MDRSGELRNAHFYCPITDEVMVDPVVDPEGNSYERAAIENWLVHNNTSPITRAPLTASQLVPNRSLKKAIEDEIANGMGVSDTPRQNVSTTTAEFSPATTVSLNEPNVTMTIGNLSECSEPGMSTVDILVSVHTPDTDVRQPIDVVCVVDVSGSMGSPASTQGSESSGLSLLDIVKHALKTIINTLGEKDRLSLVSYSNTATVVFGLTPITTAGKSRALKLVDELKPDGLTNLWDGLVKGLDILSESQVSTTVRRNSTILLLTDGVPNIEPPRGHIPMLRRYKDKYNGLFPCTISTFGFGYNLQSALLRDIALEGGGMYAFIPDSGFVGTAFVNALSNQIVALGSQTTLALEWQNGARLQSNSDLVGNPLATVSSWGVLFDIGNLYYGQRRDFVVKLSIPTPSGLNYTNLVYVVASMKYTPFQQAEGHSSGIASGETPRQSDDEIKYLDVQSFRLQLVDCITKCLSDGIASDSPASSQLACRMRNWLNDNPKLKDSDDSTVRYHDMVTGILNDLTGQVTEAVSQERYFDKWGKHYLPSLRRAHEIQQCNNFKDPGIQYYGGSLFRSVRDFADDVFCSLPPPTPSTPTATAPAAKSTSRFRSCGSAYQPAASTGVFSMRSFHNSSTPCFHGSNIVRLANGSIKPVRDIVCGDVVLSDCGKCSAPIECVLKTSSRSGYMDLVVFNSGLMITPWHPILSDGKWSFPIDVNPNVQSVRCDAVYSFLLGAATVVDNRCTTGSESSRGPSIRINGIECLCFAHGIIGDKVASHPFYGTERVVEELSTLPGYTSGLVELREGSVMKDPVTGLACGFKPVDARLQIIEAKEKYLKTETQKCVEVR